MLCWFREVCFVYILERMHCSVLGKVVLPRWWMFDSNAFKYSGRSVFVVIDADVFELDSFLAMAVG